MSSATPPRMGQVMSIQDFEGHGPEEPDSFDALRDLFLGGADDPPSPPVTEEPPAVEPFAPDEHPAAIPSFPRIEALILGHLPVQQSPWVMQYARHAASQRGGPVGLLRIREGEATLDVVGGSISPDIQSPATLDEAIAANASELRGLIVRVDATSEPLLPGLPCIDALTLLAGANESAVVDSYQRVKTLIAAAEDSLPQLRLAIMGSTPEKAVPAAEKIQRAVAAYLKQELVVTACLARIAAGRSSLVFRGLVTEELSELLDRIRRILEGKFTRSAPAVSTPPAIVPPSPMPPVAADAPTESPVVSRLGHAAASPAQSFARPEPAAAPAMGTPSLASHIQGLKPTPIICPFHAGVEFALDQQGTLHLLVHAPNAADLPAAFGRLHGARAWAGAHASLIAMALSPNGRPSAASPVLHLLTGDAKAGRGLGETGICLHLLARVEVDHHRGWFCTELA